MSDELNIHQRMLKASGMIEKLSKDGQCKIGNGGFKYTSHDAYVEAVRPVLIECGIYVNFKIVNGNMVAMFHNVDDPTDSIESVMPMIIQRTDDPKALGASASYNKKYILALNLMISTGEDVDITEEHTRNQKAAEKAAKEAEALKANGAQLVNDLGLSQDDKNRLWNESGRDLKAYVSELERMADQVAADEAKEMEGAGQ